MSGRGQAIIAYLLGLARPGGTVYVVDSDPAGIWAEPADPDLADLADLLERYAALHAARGNDLRVARRLGALLEGRG